MEKEATLESGFFKRRLPVKTIAKTFALALACLLSACAHSSNAIAKSDAYAKAGVHSVGEYTSDAFITSKVKTKYLKDLVLKAFGISVSTTNGIVSLTGSLPSQALVDRAVLIAKNTKGVKAVNSTNLVTPLKAMLLQPLPKHPAHHKTKPKIKTSVTAKSSSSNVVSSSKVIVNPQNPSNSH